MITLLFRDVLDLLVLEEGTNENGFPVIEVNERIQVFANKKSVRSNEFYLASQSGYKLEKMFEVRSVDYNSQTFLDYDSKRYEIIRTYDKGELIELVCQLYSDKP